MTDAQALWIAFASRQSLRKQLQAEGYIRARFAGLTEDQAAKATEQDSTGLSPWSRAHADITRILEGHYSTEACDAMVYLCMDAVAARHVHGAYPGAESPALREAVLAAYRSAP